jgi:hypothetical protein
MTPQQAAKAGTLRYQDGWQALRGLLAPDSTVNKSNPGLVDVREAWEEAQLRLAQAGDLSTGNPQARAGYYAQSARIALSLAWLARLLGEAKGWAGDATSYLDLAQSVSPGEASAWGGDWVRQRANKILATPGPDSDLAPQWGAKFLDAPAGAGAAFAWLAVAAGLYQWAKS